MFTVPGSHVNATTFASSPPRRASRSCSSNEKSFIIVLEWQ